MNKGFSIMSLTLKTENQTNERMRATDLNDVPSLQFRISFELHTTFGTLRDLGDVEFDTFESGYRACEGGERNKKEEGKRTY